MSERIELWKVCEDYPRYEVSNLGQVRNKKTLRILKPAGGENYQQYCLKKDDGKSYCEYGHRLVAKAFIPNLSNLNHVHHKDGKRWHNEADNLEWMDRREHQKLHCASGSSRIEAVKKSWTPERRAKQAEWMRSVGKKSFGKWDDDRRKKASLSQKAQYDSEAGIARKAAMSAGMKAYWANRKSIEQ